LPGVDDIEFQDWSRDGKWLYLSRKDTDPQSRGRSQLWKVNLASGGQLQLTKSGGSIGEESANGEFLYYVRVPDRKLRRVPTSGGPESPLFNERMDAFAVGSKSIYFVPNGPPDGGARVLRFDVATGAVADLAAIGFVPNSLQLRGQRSSCEDSSRNSRWSPVTAMT
jgi:hypothetical protein